MTRGQGSERAGSSIRVRDDHPSPGASAATGSLYRVGTYLDDSTPMTHTRASGTATTNDFEPAADANE
ncbi:hypothetical protein BRC86_05705 [Halobacteriales archaeon QS_3_64_16]|nr:MAG: hypothetical protein BRC86_05705 [Halobacteriales archaeon QS_3_64_16]